jgi:hypothetical protein
MATYSSEDFERIAAAISQNVAGILEHKHLFEWAADWYGLDCGLPRDAPRRPRRMPPSKMHDKLQRLAKNARRLMKDTIRPPRGSWATLGGIDDASSK